MALKGSDLSATYKDWVHVNQSGAGLADHAGAEAALYVDDGDGGVDQILGRTAVRHWLDPHPDAASFAETWEFSTKGTMTQAQLETAGWTFSNCTGKVENGLLWLTASDAAVAKAYLTVSLAGDFDFTCSSTLGDDYGDSISTNLVGLFGVGDDTGATDVLHYVGISQRDASPQNLKYVNGLWSSHGGTGSYSNVNTGYPGLFRVWRVSGTVYVNAGSKYTVLLEDTTGIRNDGMPTPASVADATTFTKLALVIETGASAVGDKIGYYFLRRFQ